MGQRRMPFIVFEGLDGSGNSTQSFALKEWLDAKGFEVYLTKEPTDGLIGCLIRGILRKELTTDEETLSLLFAADRMLHIKNIISKFLNNGIIVISDRYRLSNFAYQSIMGVDINWLKCLNEKTIKPDLTFVIDTPPVVCIRRIQKQRFHMELFEEVDKLTKVMEKYYLLAKDESNAFIIDGNRPKEIVSNEIFQKVIESRVIPGLERMD